VARFSYPLVVLFALCLMFVLLVAAPAAAQRPPAGPEEAAGVQVLESGNDGLLLSLHVPTYAVDTAGVLSAPGLAGRTAEPGAPALPYYSTLIALPPEATASITIQTQDDASSRLPRSLAAAPRPALDPRDAPGGIMELEEMPRELEALTSPDPALYARDELFPESVYRLSEPMYFRDLRVVRLDLYPLRVNPARNLLEHSRQIDVSVRFEGASFANLHPAPTAGDRFVAALAGELLNPEQAAVWRSLPDAPSAPTAGLPVGRDSYRIVVQEDGIYEITRDQLSAAGMNVNSVNPNTLEMMYRGEPVAYQWVGNNNNSFEADEKIRFYGWAFDGPRSEDQYITENVFWLWAGGTPIRIGTLPAGSGVSTPPNFRDEITHAPRRQYEGTWLDEDDWANFPNEPDSWYWEYIDFNSPPGTVHDVTRSIDLPHPASSGTATLTVELLSNVTFAGPYSDVRVSMGPHQIETTWLSPSNDNMELELPASALVDGANNVRLTFSNNRAIRTTFYLNRFTVAYPRLFIADDNQLIFHGPSGNQTYAISGYTQNTPLIWEIGDRLRPRAVPSEDIQVSGSYAFTFDGAASASTYIAVASPAIKEPAITRYDAPSLDPAGGADWLAISYPDFIAPLQPLAAHRADPRFGGLDTAIVSVEDVINQYGYGLPLPDAIRDYLAHALHNWQRKPHYVLLVGDATLNPHHATCDGQNPAYRICNYWSDDQQINYVPTHLPFKDRFQGQIASDYPNVLLAGNDFLPDMAIGRLAVQSATQVQNIVAKIVAFETAHLSPGAVENSLVFLSDNTDGGGNFCADNAAVAAQLPFGFMVTQICQADSTQAAVQAARNALAAAVNPPRGAAILSYRGHGSVFNWGDNLVNVNESYDWLWANNEPLVILSMDCLDGNFSFPAMTSLSETFLALGSRGSVAHWSSTGLGYTFEHFRLQSDFFKAIYSEGIVPIGDAINYAKVQYAGTPLHKSELWSFTLQGDPAMKLGRLDVSSDYLFLPFVNR